MGSGLKPGVKSLDVGKNGKMLVGTLSAEVFEVNAATGAHGKTIVQGHFEGVKSYSETWACAVHPKEQKFASGGADKTVRIWDSQKMLKVSAQFTYDITALSWSADGKFLAMGDRKGIATILDANTLEPLGNMTASNPKAKKK